MSQDSKETRLPGQPTSAVHLYHLCSAHSRPLPPHSAIHSGSRAQTQGFMLAQQALYQWNCISNASIPPLPWRLLVIVALCKSLASESKQWTPSLSHPLLPKASQKLTWSPCLKVRWLLSGQSPCDGYTKENSPQPSYANYPKSESLMLTWASTRQTRPLVTFQGTSLDHGQEYKLLHRFFRQFTNQSPSLWVP